MSELSAALAAIESWSLSDAIRRSVWTYPALETVHIAAFATVFGALMLLELRVFGAGPALPLTPLARLAVPVALVAFVIAAIAGVLMFITNATELVPNRAFQIKLVLIALAGIADAGLGVGPGSEGRRPHRSDRLCTGRWQASIARRVFVPERQGLRVQDRRPLSRSVIST